MDIINATVPECKRIRSPNSQIRSALQRTATPSQAGIGGLLKNSGGQRKIVLGDAKN